MNIFFFSGVQEKLALTSKTAEQYLSMCKDLELRVKEQDEVSIIKLFFVHLHFIPAVVITELILFIFRLTNI